MENPAGTKNALSPEPAGGSTVDEDGEGKLYSPAYAIRKKTGDQKQAQETDHKQQKLVIRENKEKVSKEAKMDESHNNNNNEDKEISAEGEDRENQQKQPHGKDHHRQEHSNKPSSRL